MMAGYLFTVNLTSISRLRFDIVECCVYVSQFNNPYEFTDCSVVNPLVLDFDFIVHQSNISVSFQLRYENFDAFVQNSPAFLFEAEYLCSILA